MPFPTRSNGQSLKNDAEFYIEYFATDLPIMSEDGQCLGRGLLEPRGARHVCTSSNAQARGPGHRRLHGRAYFSATSASYLHGRRGGMVARAGLPSCRTWSSSSSPPTGIYGAGCLITEGARGDGGLISTNSRGRAVHGALRAHLQGPRVPRRGLTLHDHGNPRRGAAVGAREGPHVSPPQPPAARNAGPAPAGHFRKPPPPPRIFAGVDLTREPIPVIPTVHYNMGGIPTNYWGEVAGTRRRRDPDAIVPGLMAVGEAGCASVHGANRLGSNSLIDLVVFGRAAAIKAGEVVEADGPNPRLNQASVDKALTRFDDFRHAKGTTPTAELASRCRRPCSRTPPSSAPTKTLAEGVEKMYAVAGKLERRPCHRTGR